MQHCLVKHTAHPHMVKRRSWASKVWHNVDCSDTPEENSYGGAITEENLSAGAGRNTNVRDMYLSPPWKNVRNMTPLNLLYDTRCWNDFFPGGTLRWICVHMLKWTQEKGSESPKVGLHPSTTCRRDLPRPDNVPYPPCSSKADLVLRLHLISNFWWLPAALPHQYTSYPFSVFREKVHFVI